MEMEYDSRKVRFEKIYNKEGLLEVWTPEKQIEMWVIPEKQIEMLEL